MNGEVWSSCEYLHTEYVVKRRTSADISNEHNINYDTICERLRRFGIEIRGFAPYQRSVGEIEVADFVKSIVGEDLVETNKTLNCMNFDIVIPSKKLLIEYDGLYWHSSGCVKPESSTKMFQAKKQIEGWRTIHIFEDEWIYNKNVVKRYLLNQLNKSAVKCYARNCDVVDVKRNDANLFYNNNHLLGETFSIEKTIALKFNDEIVSMMSIKKVDSNTIEIIRFVSSINVVGGFSKLLKNLKCTYPNKTIQSFLDMSKFDRFNNVYLKHGFIECDLIKPDYQVVVNNKRIHKFSLRKNILKKLACEKSIEVSANETEFDLHQKLGFHRIYDVGKVRYKFH
jgi:sulfur carrier protein ThiS